MTKGISRTFLVASVAVLFWVFSLITRATPWADEWFMVALEPQSFEAWLKWLFSQHNDHFIVVQKVLQGILIRISGFDFRSLVLLNLAVIVGTAWATIKLAEEFRGRSSLLDVTVVLALCCVGPGSVIWSSTFAFPATNLVAATFALIWIQTLNSGRSVWRSVFTTLLLCTGPLIAAGGAVATTVLCLCLWYLRLLRKDVVLPVQFWGLTVATVVNAIAWVAFRPSAGTGINPGVVPDFLIGLGGSSIYWWDLPMERWKDLLATAVIVAAVVYSVTLFLRREASSKGVVLASLILAIFGVMTSIAIARSAYTAWEPQVKVHYGIATALLIPLSLLLFERKSRMFLTLSVAFILIYAGSYAVALRYQVAVLNSVRPANLVALYTLAHSADLERDITSHWRDYWWRDGDLELAPLLAERVEFMRANGGTLYSPWRQ